MSEFLPFRRISRLFALSGAALFFALAGSLLVEHLDRWPRGFGQSPQAPVPVVTAAQQIEALQGYLRAQPEDASAYTRLGEIYLQRGRETGDPTYYSKAEGVLQEALRRRPTEVDTLNALGTLALARHQFAEALTLAEQVQALNPANARSYGIAGDALAELGRYDEAFAAYQTMVDRRPDLASYARVSHARELLGDRAGAIDAMQRAIVAGGSITEATNWVTVQLGQLYFGQGDLTAAEAEYQRVLTRSPDYAPALAGLAAVRAAQEQPDAAIDLYQQSLALLPAPEYAIALGELLEAIGRPDEARPHYGLVRVYQQLNQSSGVEVDLELALFEADHGDPATALEQARRSQAKRPSIQGDLVLAWSLYRTGACQEALTYSTRARRLGTQDALLLYRTGLIAACAGQPEEARTLLTSALTLNPAFSPWHALEARRILASLS